MILTHHALVPVPQNNFMHTFPRNQQQQQPPNLRTTASGIDPSLPSSGAVIQNSCCNANQQRRKTVTFLDTTIQCHNSFGNSGNDSGNSEDGFPLPPPPEEVNGANNSNSTGNDASDYVESRV